MTSSGETSFAASLRDSLRRHENRGRMSIDDERDRGPSRCPKRMHATLIDFDGCALLFVVASHLRRPAGQCSYLFPNLSQCRQDDTGPRIAPAGFELVTVGEALLLLSQPFDSARLMLLCCLLKRRLDLGFHFSAFLRKRPTPTCELFLLPPRWTLGGAGQHREATGADEAAVVLTAPNLRDSCSRTD